MRKRANVIRRAMVLVRQYWVLAAAMSLLVLAFAVGSPAWAAPPSSQKYQTVPRPTPTPEGDPVATATPRPDDDDDDDSDTGSGGTIDGTGDAEREVPVFLFGPEPGTESLSATVSVSTLNVREGPGIRFPIVGALAAGDVVSVLWRNEENTWWYICCIAGTSDGGWASAQLLAPDFDRATSADVIPVFGVEAQPAQAQPETAANTDVVAASASSKLPIVLNVSLSPPFLRQGQTGELVLEVSNPNLQDVLNVELSDQLPPELELVEVSATGQGRVSERATDAGTPLVLVRWATVPAGESVEAVLTVTVLEDLADGVVFDNLAAARGANATYVTGAVTIGMPPVLLPDFQ
jgi:uncharacterized repeat protein (TIGR01451 family)